MSGDNCRRGLLLALCIAAGMVDVTGYLGLGHVFTANMTGNIVLLGMAAAHARGFAVLRSATALLAFMAGNALAAVIVGGRRDRMLWPPQVTRILWIEGLLLLGFGFFFGPQLPEGRVYPLIILLSLAMGMQTTAARSLGVAGISTTVLTSTLANMMEDLTAGLRKRGGAKDGDGPRGGNPLSSDSLLRALALAAYCAGAFTATILMRVAPGSAIWIPLILLAGVIVFASIVFRPRLPFPT
jgi:uncharacterized membrane protein YoaK (UPF0700 family)